MRPTERCEILSATPRLTASRASSLWLQWVIGRPLAEGGSQARARIAQTCSAVKVAGAPARGASARRSVASPVPLSQRCRQWRTVLGSIPNAHAGAAQQDDPYPQGQL